MFGLPRLWRNLSDKLPVKETPAVDLNLSEHPAVIGRDGKARHTYPAAPFKTLPWNDGQQHDLDCCNSVKRPGTNRGGTRAVLKRWTVFGAADGYRLSKRIVARMGLVINLSKDIAAGRNLFHSQL